KATVLVARDHDSGVCPVSVLVRRRSGCPPPPASITYRLFTPLTAWLKTMRLPSGDQTGLFPPLNVSRVGAPRCTSKTQQRVHDVLDERDWRPGDLTRLQAERHSDQRAVLHVEQMSAVHIARVGNGRREHPSIAAAIERLHDERCCCPVERQHRREENRLRA